MNNLEKRIEALEAKVAALESKNQAPQAGLTASENELADIVIRVLNKRTMEKGKDVLLI